MIQSLASAHRLRVRREYDEYRIVGRKGLIAGTFSGYPVVVVQLGTPRQWNNARRRLLLAGLIVHQDGENEGSMLLDPSNRVQVRAAIAETGVRQKRVLTPEQRTNLIGRLRQSARASAENRVIRAPKPTNATGVSNGRTASPIRLSTVRKTPASRMPRSHTPALQQVHNE